MSEAHGFDNISSFRKIEQVRKRNGTLVPYDLMKITVAVNKAMNSENEGSSEDAAFIARCVQSAMQRAGLLVGAQQIVPSVESIQDAVERELMLHGYTKTAKHYILYREERAKVRAARDNIPPHVRSLVEGSKRYFPNSLSEFIYYRTYSRWKEDEGRRETWVETVQRYMDFMEKNLGDKLTRKEYYDIQQAIVNMEVMPSMRLMWAAGAAANATNVAAFNCSYIAPTMLKDFGEILYILACGTGVGFSAESRNIQQLPVISHQTGRHEGTYLIEDSKEGWANALVDGMTTWYEGKDIRFDYSLLRPAGARLKTMGGRSSGPQPLVDLLTFTRSTILKRQGRRLTNLDAHDIICKIGDCIVAGGVRRSALISLSDLDDEEMRHAKEGHFYITNNQRQLANNSAVYTEKPSDEMFLKEWLALVQSGSGERGIFNRGDILRQIPQRRVEEWINMGAAIKKDGLNNGKPFFGPFTQVGTNPCGEINLLSKQFCNLSEVVCRASDTQESLLRKICIATIIGTYQSTLTSYPYLSEQWKTNCERERLLGVSLTGQWDCIDLMDFTTLALLKEEAIKTNKKYAQRFGISPSTAITCVKPSGTVSQLVDASSGMHPRHAQYYIRRVRIAATDPLFKMLKDQGLPYFPEVGQTYDTATTFVLEFPVKSPALDSSAKPSALSQLNYWKKVKTAYTEHNPSQTISVGNYEWIDVMKWIWDNWENVGGLSFLPEDDHIYQLAPYEEITEEKYLFMLKQFEGIDYSKIVTYEREDQTQGSKELACVAGVCEI